MLARKQKGHANPSSSVYNNYFAVKILYKLSYRLFFILFLTCYNLLIFEFEYGQFSKSR